MLEEITRCEFQRDNAASVPVYSSRLFELIEETFSVTGVVS